MLEVNNAKLIDQQQMEIAISRASEWFTYTCHDPDLLAHCLHPVLSCMIVRGSFGSIPKITAAYQRCSHL